MYQETIAKKILTYLRNHEGELTTHDQLTSALHLDKPTLFAHLDFLESQGYITKGVAHEGNFVSLKIPI